MKKALLSLIAVWLSAFASIASEHTIVFDGTNDIGGLTRLTKTPTKDQCVSELSFTDEDINFSIGKDGTGWGFALVHTGNAKAEDGLYVSSTNTPTITLTVPNGKINAVNISLSGYSLAALDIDFNGTSESGKTTDTKIYSWSWTNAEGVETVTITWPTTYMARYIHTIDVIYTPDLGGKQKADLSFSEGTAEAIQGKDFTEPTLSNPNNLDITWSSSNENVATVDENGEVTLVGGGSAVITAATVGNDEYAKGNAKYTLNVVPSAANIAELAEKAPALNNQVYVDFPVTVAFCKNSNAYVIDEAGNACCINNAKNDAATGSSGNVYKTGDVVPAGWVATNSSEQELVWKGLPPEVTETVEVEYPEVTAIDYKKDAFKVVTLKDVTFTTTTASGETKANGTTPDGTSYTFDDSFGTPGKPAGTYDVTVVVKYSEYKGKVYEWLAPIAYIAPLDVPTELTITSDPAGLEISQVFDDEDNIIYIIVNGTIEEETATLTFDLPEGWDGVIGAFAPSFGYMSNTANRAPARMPANAEGWTSIEKYKEENEIPGTEIVEGTKISIPVDGAQHMGMFHLYAGDQVYEALRIQISTKVGQPAPEIPEEFDITFSCDGLTVEKDSQPMWYGIYNTITVKGECATDEITATLTVPEGWDGFYCYTEDGEVSVAKAPEMAKAASMNVTWGDVEDLVDEDTVEGNSVTFPVNGEEQEARFYLYKGDKYVSNLYIVVNMTITKKEGGEPEGPAFPEEFAVTTNPEGLECEQAFEYGTHNINITGESTTDEVIVSVEVPEGWDGFIALEYDKYAPDVKPLTKAPKAATEIDWGSLEEMLADGYVKTNGFTFPADGEEQTGTLLLYKGDKVDTTNEIWVNVTVEKTSEPEPVLEFPETFNVSVSPEGLEVSKKGESDAYYVEVKGKTEEKEVSVTFEVPEGWDGFVGGANPFGTMAKAAAKVPVDEYSWQSVDAMIEYYGFEKTNTFTFDTDAEAYDYMVCLYKGDMMYVGSAIRLKVEVEGPAEPEGPAFPEEFTVTTNPEGLECEQAFEYGTHNINITGESTTDEVIVSVEVPEGWDGFIALEYDKYAPDVKPLTKAPKAATEIDWGSLEEMLADGYVKTNGFTFPADGEEQTGTLLLYKGDKVDTTNEIWVNVTVEKTSEPEPVLEFPETFNVSVSPEGLEVSKKGESDAYYVEVKGKTEEKEVSVTFEVPEGWDGFVGGANPYGTMAKAAAKVPVDEYSWQSVDLIMEYWGFEKTNTFTFDTDAEAYDYMICLYKGDMMYVGSAIRLTVDVEGPAEPEPELPAFPEAFEATVSVESVEMTQGDEQGVYTISVKGESDQENVTVTVKVPEEWDGFLGMSEDDINPDDINPMAKIAKAADDEEDSWIPVEAMLGAGMKKANSFTFAVDGDEHTAQLYLYKGDKVYVANHVEIYFEVAKAAEPEPEPEFPESIGIAADSETVTIEQGYDEEIEAIAITVGGKTANDNVKFTFTLPEGWDGVIGTIAAFGAEEPAVMARSAEEWTTIEDFKAAMGDEEIVEGTEITVPADGKQYIGSLHLYAGDKVYVSAGFMLAVNVAKTTSGITEIEGEDGEDVRYFNIHGVEVVNPTSGIYVKVANGKASKVVVK